MVCKHQQLELPSFHACLWLPSCLALAPQTSCKHGSPSNLSPRAGQQGIQAVASHGVPGGSGKQRASTQLHASLHCALPCCVIVSSIGCMPGSAYESNQHPCAPRMELCMATNYLAFPSKMNVQEGQGLGASGHGPTEPIPLHVKQQR